LKGIIPLAGDFGVSFSLKFAVFLFFQDIFIFLSDTAQKLPRKLRDNTNVVLMASPIKNQAGRRII
jgi:hypothetical protein